MNWCGTKRQPTPLHLAAELAPRNAASPRLLIIGYGNPTRTDDGAGVAAAERLAARLPDGVLTLTPHQLTPELAQDLAEAGEAWFCDASVDLPAGEWSVNAITERPATLLTSGHHVTPAALLACAESIYGRSPAAKAITFGVASLDFGTTLSPAVDRAIDAAVAHLTASSGSGLPPSGRE